ncbi:MAG: succinic semialdehyde dehydrogenase, partial [Gemmatimonadaceae bacterium]|nr:succinic semialdehyde dehydrogenase [Gemmatimonadaceae bacterium]
MAQTVPISPPRPTRADAPAPDGRVSGMRLRALASLAAVQPGAPDATVVAPFTGAPLGTIPRGAPDDVLA